MLRVEDGMAVLSWRACVTVEDGSLASGLGGGRREPVEIRSLWDGMMARAEKRRDMFCHDVTRPGLDEGAWRAAVAAAGWDAGALLGMVPAVTVRGGGWSEAWMAWRWVMDFTLGMQDPMDLSKGVLSLDPDVGEGLLAVSGTMEELAFAVFQMRPGALGVLSGSVLLAGLTRGTADLLPEGEGLFFYSGTLPDETLSVSHRLELERSAGAGGAVGASGTI